MKRLLTVALLACSLQAKAPSYHPEELLTHEGGELWSTNGKYLTPTYADWDQDGDNDLLIGYMHGSGPASSVIKGYIMHYDNIGSNDAPKFEDKGLLPLEVPSA